MKLRAFQASVLDGDPSLQASTAFSLIKAVIVPTGVDLTAEGDVLAFRKMCLPSGIITVIRVAILHIAFMNVILLILRRQLGVQRNVQKTCLNR
jgi:hypothetical protein